MAAFAFIVLPVVPLAAWLLMVGWSPNKTEGDILLQMSVPLLARIKMLALPYALGLLTMLFVIAMARTSWWMLPILLLIFVVFLAIPISYTLTTIGIRTGRGVFRRWTEFAGVRRFPGGAILQGGQRASSYPIFLGGNRDDDEFVLTLKTLVRDSYKGRSTELSRIRGNQIVSQSDGDTKMTSSINQ